MTERPILFSAPMVRALLAGTKTQTRRAVKPQPHHVDGGVPFGDPPAWAHGAQGSAVMRCPYGKRGDRLWVRETWAAPHALDGHTPRFMPSDTRVHYAATEERGGLLWRPSIHMPRWASRITLGITGVRVERLYAISEADAMAEGVETWRAGWDQKTAATMFLHGSQARAATNDGGVAQRLYHLLWESINGAGSWELNPWVWVVEFRRIGASA